MVAGFEAIATVKIIDPADLYWNLSNRNLAELPSDMFDGLTSLERLYLHDNDLTELPSDVFDDLTSLTILSLNGNNLTELPPDVFDGLTSLERLYLYDNDLTELPSDVFDGLTSLEQLYLHNNDLTELPPNVFDDLTSLTILYLHDNNLTELPPNVFDGLTSLTELSLNGNNLTELLSDVFDDLTSLERLYLHDNDLTELPSNVFDDLTPLYLLNMSDNDLTELPSDIFDGLTSLKWLYLDNNDLTELPSNVFDEVLDTLFNLELDDTLRGIATFVTDPVIVVPGRTANIVAQMDKPIPASVSIPITASGSGITITPAAIIIPAGDTNAQVTITVASNAVIGNRELRLSPPKLVAINPNGNVADLNTRSSVVGTLVRVSTTPTTITVIKPAANIIVNGTLNEEGETAATVTLQIRNIPDDYGDGLVTWTTNSGEAVDADYNYNYRIGTLPTQSGNSITTADIIPAAQFIGAPSTGGGVDIIFTFEAIDDSCDETDENITFTLNNVTFPSASPPIPEVTLDQTDVLLPITDDDTATASLASNGLTVITNGGGTAEFILVLKNLPCRNNNVNNIRADAEINFSVVNGSRSNFNFFGSGNSEIQTSELSITVAGEAALEPGTGGIIARQPSGTFTKASSATTRFTITSKNIDNTSLPKEFSISLGAVNYYHSDDLLRTLADADKSGVPTFSIIAAPTAITPILADNTVSENEDIHVTVMLDAALPENGTIIYQMLPNTSTSHRIENHDLAGGLGQRVVQTTAGQQIITFTVDVDDDNRIEYAEGGIIRILSAAWGESGSITDSRDLPFTINDNDSLAVSLNDAVHNIRDNIGTLTVIINAAADPHPPTHTDVRLDRELRVILATDDGTAVSPDDYNGEESIIAFSFSETIQTTSTERQITIADDSDDERETFHLSLTTSDAAVTLERTRSTVTIIPEAAAGYTLNPDLATTEGDPDDTAHLTLELFHAPDADATVVFMLSGGTVPGDMHMTADGARNTLPITYNSDGTTGTFIIPFGDSPTIITFTAANDNDATDESITFTITGITFTDGVTHTDIAPLASTTITITDNDPTASLAVTDGDASEKNNEPGRLTLTIGKPPGATATVTFTLGGTATQPTSSTDVDYHLTVTDANDLELTVNYTDTATASFLLSIDSADAIFTVTPITDRDDDDETVIITVTRVIFSDSASNIADIITPTTARAITIADYGDLPSANLDIQGNGLTFSEGQVQVSILTIANAPPKFTSKILFHVASDATLHNDYTFTVVYDDPSSDTMQTAAMDFTAMGTADSPYSFTLPAGISMATLTTSLIEDSREEARENLRLTLSSVEFADEGTGTDITSFDTSININIAASVDMLIAELVTDGTLAEKTLSTGTFTLQLSNAPLPIAATSFTYTFTGGILNENFTVTRQISDGNVLTASPVPLTSLTDSLNVSTSTFSEGINRIADIVFIITPVNDDNLINEVITLTISNLQYGSPDTEISNIINNGAQLFITDDDGIRLRIRVFLEGIMH